eukprot:Rmarinus@m.21441
MSIKPPIGRGLGPFVPLSPEPDRLGTIPWTVTDFMSTEAAIAAMAPKPRPLKLAPLRTKDLLGDRRSPTLASSAIKPRHGDANFSPKVSTKGFRSPSPAEPLPPSSKLHKRIVSPRLKRTEDRPSSRHRTPIESARSSISSARSHIPPDLIKKIRKLLPMPELDKDQDTTEPPPSLSEYFSNVAVLTRAIEDAMEGITGHPGDENDDLREQLRILDTSTSTMVQSLQPNIIENTMLLSSLNESLTHRLKTLLGKTAIDEMEASFIHDLMETEQLKKQLDGCIGDVESHQSTTVRTCSTFLQGLSEIKNKQARMQEDISKRLDDAKLLAGGDGEMDTAAALLAMQYSLASLQRYTTKKELEFEQTKAELEQAMEDLNEKLRATIQKSLETEKILNGKITQLVLEVQDLEEKLKWHKEMLALREGELEQANQKISEYEFEVEDLKLTIIGLGKVIDELKPFKIKAEQLEKKVEDLEKEVEDRKKQFAELQQTYARTRQALDETKERLEVVEKNLEITQSELIRTQEELRLKDLKLQEAEIARAKLKKDLDILRDDYEELEKKHTEAVNEVKRMEKELVKLEEKHKQQIDDLNKKHQDTVKKFEEKLKVLREELNRQRLEFEETLKKKEEECRERVEKAERQANYLKEQLAEEQAQKRRYLEEIKVLNAKLAELEGVAKKLELLKSENSHLRETLKEVRAEAARRENELLGEIREWESKTKAATERAEAAETRIERLEGEKEELQDANLVLRSDVTILENQLETARITIKNLEDLLEEARSRPVTTSIGVEADLVVPQMIPQLPPTREAETPEVDDWQTEEVDDDDIRVVEDLVASVMESVDPSPEPLKKEPRSQALPPPPRPKKKLRPPSPPAAKGSMDEHLEEQKERWAKKRLRTLITSQRRWDAVARLSRAADEIAVVHTEELARFGPSIQGSYANPAFSKSFGRPLTSAEFRSSSASAEFNVGYSAGYAEAVGLPGPHPRYGRDDVRGKRRPMSARTRGAAKEWLKGGSIDDFGTPTWLRTRDVLDDASLGTMARAVQQQFPFAIPDVELDERLPKSFNADPFALLY